MSRVDIYGLARQTAGFGTPVTTMEYYPTVSAVDVQDRTEVIEVEETIGNPFPTEIDKGVQFFEIGIRSAPRYTSLPRRLSGFFGQPTTGAAVSSVYPHVFDPAAAGKTPEFHSMFVVREDPATAIVDLFEDCIGSEFALDVVANQAVQMQEQWVAAGLDSSQSSPTPSRDTSGRMKFKHVLVYLTIDGGSEAEIKCGSWGFTYGNNPDTDQAVLGSQALYSLPVGNRSLQVRFSPRESLSTYYRRALQLEPTSVKVRMLADNGGSGSARRALEVIAYSLEEIEAPANIDAASVLKTVPVVARGKYDTTASKLVQVTCHNSVATF